MAHIVIMPRQGNTVESCIIVAWVVKEGDTVTEESVICQVETDKAVFDVPAGASGTVLEIVRPAGDDVPVLEPIAVVGTPGESYSVAQDSAPVAAPGVSESAAAGPTTATDSATTARDASAPAAGAEVAVSPRARHAAAAKGVDATKLSGTGPAGRVIERDVNSALGQQLTAAARALAANGAALPSSGTALGGRVGVADLAGASSPVVDAVLEGVVTLDRAAPARALRLFPGPVSEAPLKGIRKLIADRMRSSLSAHAQLTLHSSAPAARLLELRARFKASDPKLGLSSVTIGDLALFAVSRVLPRFPFMNAHMMGATVTSFEHVHLGFAVDTPRGLMVPVIRFADELSLRELSAEAKRLASACSAGTATPDELGGSTFTVTNLGAFGIESFTPVLNSPEVGILGVCSVVERPEAGRNEARMGLSLTIDHQVVDGAPAARFLQALVGAIADMDLLVVS